MLYIYGDTVNFNIKHPRSLRLIGSRLFFMVFQKFCFLVSAFLCLCWFRLHVNIYCGSCKIRTTFVLIVNAQKSFIAALLLLLYLLSATILCPTCNLKEIYLVHESAYFSKSQPNRKETYFGLSNCMQRKKK